VVSNSNGRNDSLGPSGPITPQHLRRLAVVYCRQSTLQQVQQHQGSAAAQRDLVEVAFRLGWPKEQVHVIDADLGISGISTAGRSGYLELLTLMDGDKVGVVISQELSRLGRKRSDMALFLETAEEKGILIYTNGGLHNPASDDLTTMLGLDIAGTFGTFDNRLRAKRMREAKLARARRGHAVSPAPIGYVRTSDGGWDKDPDRDVQQTIQLAFELYVKLGALGKVVKYFRASGLQFPRRRRGQLRWGALDAALLHSLLRNRAYCGDYIFLQRQTKKRSDGMGVTVRRRPAHEWIEVLDHHQPYVAREVWQRVQDMLQARRPRIRPLIGKGPGLLQGRLHCTCGRWLRTQYWGRDRVARTATYTCVRQNGWGDITHKVTIPARYIDHAVVEHVLKALTAIDEETARGVIEGNAQEQAALERAERRQELQLEEDVDEYRRLLKSVPEAMQAARNDLWAKYDEAVQRQLALKNQRAKNTTALSISTADAALLVQLTRDVRQLWHAPQRTNEQRKQLLESVIEEILVHQADRTGADLEIVWKGGLREPLRVHRPRGVEAVVAEETRAGKTAAAIAEKLNRAGAVTACGKPVSRELVARKQGSRGLRLKDERRRALQLIHQRLLIDRLPRREIRQQLDAEAPRLGPWTPQRLSDYIRILRRRVGDDLGPVPHTMPAEVEKRSALAVMEEALAAKKGWTKIATLLNEAGLKPPRGMAFTPVQARLLYMRARGLSSLVLPAPTDTTEAGA
jgi:DNA invertase Pin-like site-specific DNA recombinase